ncbi:SDR family NAD(P)-dependent oxidoreductase [Actinotalea sp. AC32]|nr:SDR family NAD(P)-dependent oxidoreductase [Actinotalea sp. AC32]
MTASIDAPRTALVTGAGRGIGRGLALGLAAAGWSVALVGRTREHLEAVAAEIEQAGPPGGVRTLVLAVDVTDADGVRDAVATAERELDGLGLVVNNAGVIERTEGPFADDDLEDAWRVVEVNVRGPMVVTHAVLPGMVRRGGGRIANVNSGSGYHASRSYTGYGISKGALARLTTLVDAQYRDRGVRVFDLAPGVVRTDMTGAMPLHDDREEWTPVEASVDLLVGIGDGRLDALSGRFFRAGADTVEELVSRTDEILGADARRLRLVPYGAGDPLRT